MKKLTFQERWRTCSTRSFFLASRNHGHDEGTLKHAKGLIYVGSCCTNIQCTFDFCICEFSTYPRDEPGFLCQLRRNQPMDSNENAHAEHPPFDLS